jgi:cell division septum initiation protein DivIVA
MEDRNAHGFERICLKKEPAMATTITGFTPEQGLHTVTFDGRQAPTAPAVQPPVPAEEPQETPQPDAAGQLAESPGESGDTPSPTDPDPEEAALADPQPRKDRPFVARTLRENQSLRDQNAQLQAQLAYFTQQLQRSAGQPREAQTTPPPSQPSALRPPRQEDYTDMAAFSRDVEQYWRAMAAEEARNLLTTAFRERDQQELERQAQAVLARVNSKVREGRTKYDDFDEALAVLDAELNGHELYGVLKQQAAQSPKGADLLRHVGLHADVLQELKYRTPEGAAYYLATLEAQLGQPPPARHTRTVSTTPPPPPAPPLPAAVRPLNGAGGIAHPLGATPAEIAQRQGAFADYTRAMRQQEQERRRR